MSEKIINTRIIQRHDTEENWNSVPDFIPKQGELIVYDGLNKFKIGDGVSTIINLPFSTMDLDAVPTKDSENGVTSGGVYNEIIKKVNSLGIVSGVVDYNGINIYLISDEVAYREVILNAIFNDTSDILVFIQTNSNKGTYAHATVTKSRQHMTISYREFQAHYLLTTYITYHPTATTADERVVITTEYEYADSSRWDDADYAYAAPTVEAVQLALEDKYEKPENGIPASDIAPGVIPDALSQLSSDATHRVVTDAEKALWNSNRVFTINYSDNDTAIVDIMNEILTCLNSGVKVSVSGIVEDVGYPAVMRDNRTISIITDDTFYNISLRVGNKGVIKSTTPIYESDLVEGVINAPQTDAVYKALETKQGTITDLDTIRTGASKGNTAYQKPSTGIPKTDLATDVLPTALSQLSSDASHRLVTDTEKSTWNNKQDKLTASVDYATPSELNSVSDDVASIKSKISSQATSTNKLVSFSEMGDAIASVEAKQIYKTSTQGSFATKAELLSATIFYNADGSVAIPTKNDVAYVLADESHENKSAKYTIASTNPITWGFVITFSASTFTQAQLDAINSGITSDKRASYDSHIEDDDIHITSSERSSWNNKQSAITSTNKLSADLIQDGTNNKVFTSAEKTKLSNIVDYTETEITDLWNEVMS